MWAKGISCIGSNVETQAVFPWSICTVAQAAGARYGIVSFLTQAYAVPFCLTNVAAGAACHGVPCCTTARMRW
jgi:Na+/H+ antiporter NhaC